MLTALVLALGLFGCEDAPRDPTAPANTLRLVSSLPEKGYAAPQARQIEQAIDLAVKQRSATAGGWKIEHIALNDSDDETGEWSRAKEIANAQRAADDPSVLAYIGPYESGAVMVSLPITNKAGLLLSSPSGTWPGLTRSGWNPAEPDVYYPTGQRNFVRMMPADSLQADAAVQWAVKLNLKVLRVISDGSSYSEGLAQEFIAAGARYNLDTSQPIEVTPPNVDQLAGKLAGADAVFYAPSNISFAVDVAKALTESGITVFASDTALSAQFAVDAGIATQNWHIISNSADFTNNTDYRAFAQLFKATYDSEPGQFAANAYSLTNLMLDKIAAGSSTRETLITSVLATRGYPGATGPVSFDATGDRTEWRMMGYRPVDGVFKLDSSFDGQVAP